MQVYQKLYCWCLLAWRPVLNFSASARMHTFGSCLGAPTLINLLSPALSAWITDIFSGTLPRATSHLPPSRGYLLITGRNCILRRSSPIPQRWTALSFRNSLSKSFSDFCLWCMCATRRNCQGWVPTWLKWRCKDTWRHICPGGSPAFWCWGHRLIRTFLSENYINHVVG